MDLKNFKTPLYFLIFGVCWALMSDPLIILLARGDTLGITESFRGVNDLVFVGLAAVLLYLQVRKERFKLMRSERQYKQLFLTNPNPMWVYHTESLRFIEVNDATIQKYGYSRKEFLAMTILDIRPAADLARVKESVRSGENMIEDGSLWEHILRSGVRIRVRVTAHRLKFNNLPCSMVMVTDVTDIEKSNMMLRDAVVKEHELNETLEEKLELLRKAHKESRRMAEVIDKISNLVLIVGESGRITWINRAFTEFTGYEPADAIGENPAKLLFGAGTDPDCIRQIIGALGRKSFFSGEIINYKKSGEAYWTQLNISPIFDDRGEFEFFISVENIITERKEKEARLLDLYKAFREIAWANSHEVRKPLASMLSLVEILLQSSAEEERNECLKMVEACAKDLDGVIRESARKINALEQREDNLPVQE
ncbi:PAS domain S-box protein [Hufsiella ginkgonis]|uniref:histidine kinase n=1 Tax=Hufsiella ginkgonis TaxID=2695274 RepID=A0A7K1XZR2_9SPHI|nr:PAS domain S-box protein [Hufsiella ginkgonis]MXV16504.1 PAS domain S-box protein [Hufsiella ginkgonis]